MACMPWRAHIAKHPQRQRQVISTGKPLINRPIHRVEPFNPPYHHPPGRRFSPTWFIRRLPAVVRLASITSASDKRYSFPDIRECPLCGSVVICKLLRFRRIRGDTPRQIWLPSCRPSGHLLRWHGPGNTVPLASSSLIRGTFKSCRSARRRAHELLGAKRNRTGMTGPLPG